MNLSLSLKVYSLDSSSLSRKTKQQTTKTPGARKQIKTGKMNERTERLRLLK